MPQFAPNEERVAIATFPVKPAGLACTVELWLSRDGGVTKDATSGEIPFTSTGVDQSISLPVTMPSVGGFSYTVLIDPKIEGITQPGFRAIEDVTILPVAGEGYEVMWITVEPTVINAGESTRVTALVTNVSGVEGNFLVTCSVDGTENSISMHLEAEGDGSWGYAIFDFLMNEVGTYTVNVGGQTATVEVREAVTGLFCCPYCGLHEACIEWHYDYTFYGVRVRCDTVGEILSESDLANHMSSGHTQYFDRWDGWHIECPICGEQCYYPHTEGEWNESVALGLAYAVIDHIKEVHGETALYCE